MASNHSIFSEDGRAIDFADIIRANYGGITIVTFVRHMYCGLCQEYLALLNRLEEHTYDKHGVDVIVIGCGDWQLIRAYKGEYTTLRPFQPQLTVSCSADQVEWPNVYRSAGRFARLPWNDVEDTKCRTGISQGVNPGMISVCTR